MPQLRQHQEENTTSIDKLIKSATALGTGVLGLGLGLTLRNLEFSQNLVHAISGIDQETVKSIGSALGTYGVIATPTGLVASYYYAVRSIFSD